MQGGDCVLPQRFRSIRVERFPPRAIYKDVTRFTKLIAPLMLALWGMAMTHCDLEHLPAFEFLACCTHPDTAPHQDQDCEQDGCAAVESGLYKIDEQPVLLPTPVFVLSLFLPLLDEVAPASVPSGGALDSAPPELLRIWQFSFRTALPPRAPSFVS